MLGRRNLFWALAGILPATLGAKSTDAVEGVTRQKADLLTESYLRQQYRQHSAAVSEAQEATSAAIHALRRELVVQNRLLAASA